MPKSKPITKAKARAIAKAKAQQKEKRKKLIMAGVIGLGVLILLIVFLTRPEAPVKRAGSFFALLAEDKTNEAYLFTSITFQDRMNEEDFKTNIKEMGLHLFASVTWAKPSISKDQAKLEGTITTKTGEKIPVQLTLVLVKRQWEIFNVSVTTPGIAVNTPGAPETPASAIPPGSATPAVSPGIPAVPIPGEEEMKSLVFDVLFNLQQAVNKNDFNPFYGYISQQWQKETTADGLRKKYQALIDKRFGRAFLVGIRPVFEQNPYVGTDDSITLTGHYTTKPLQVAFELKYVRENSVWKLSAADIKLTEDPSGIGQLPGPAELNKLVTSTLLRLNEAVTTKNFGPFYQTLAKQKRQQTTPEKLMAEYQESIDKKIDIKGIAETDPVFTDRPILNMENQFMVSGIYEAKDLTVNFQITYQFEASSWKPLTWTLNVSMIIPASEGEKSP